MRHEHRPRKMELEVAKHALEVLVGLAVPRAQLTQEAGIQLLELWRDHRGQSTVELGAPLLDETGHPARPVFGVVLQHRHLPPHGVDAATQSRESGGAVAVGCGSDHFVEDTQRIEHSLPTRDADNGGCGQLDAALFDRQQASRQVAAVDRGDKSRRERLQVGGVVPVVQVTAVALHPAQRVERLFEPEGNGQHPRIPEVVRGHRSEQEQADVRR